MSVGGGVGSRPSPEKRAGGGGNGDARYLGADDGEDLLEGTALVLMTPLSSQIISIKIIIIINIFCKQIINIILIVYDFNLLL